LRDGSQAARLPRPDHCHAVARQADIVDKAEVDDVDADLWVDDVAEEVSQHLRARFPLHQGDQVQPPVVYIAGVVHSTILTS